MPLGKFYGDHPTITGDRQVAQIPVSKAESPPIQVDRWFRNGKHPDAFAMSEMNAAFNQWAMFRTKEVFGQATILGQGSGIPVSSTSASRPRYRFAFHTSPLHGMLLARFVMYPQTSGFGENSYATLSIYSDATESTLVSTTEFYYGVNPLNSFSVVGWQYLKFIDKQITGLTKDTDYYAVITDENYGLVQSASIAELNSLTQQNGGYLPTNFTSETQILDEYRANLVENIPLLWKRGGAKVLNWTVNDQASPRTTTSTGAPGINLIDGSSTTFGASIPGFTFNMVGKARLSQSSGVPCVMSAFIGNTNALNGRLQIRDSAGTVIAACNYLGAGGAPQWFTTTLSLPATEAKYYLTLSQTAVGQTVSVYAVSIDQYET